MLIWYLIAVLLQTAIQSAWFACYLHSKRPVFYFLIIWVVSVVLFVPINLWLSNVDVILKNLVNCLFFGLLCRVLFRRESWRRIVLAILLYETILILVELFGQCISYLSTKAFFDLFSFTQLQIVLTWATTIEMAFLTILFLRFFSNLDLTNLKMLSYLATLLLNTILQVLLVFEVSMVHQNMFFDSWYWIIVVLLYGLNLFTLFSLSRFVRKEREKKSLKNLEVVYHEQLRYYLSSEQPDEEWCRLRHDLLNFMDQEHIQKKKESDFSHKV